VPDHDWDPPQYRRFAAERELPFWELLDLVEPGPVRCVVDLGCGDGDLTRRAAARFGASTTLGVDSSPAMLAGARTMANDWTSDRTTDPTGSIRFVHGDIARWPGRHDEQWDLVLANASLQWVADHETVLARWTSALGPAGQLAVQVPMNGDHASHLAATEVAGTDPFLSALGGDVPQDPTAINVLAPERYAALLHELGYEAQHVRLRVYPHVLSSSDDVVEWVRGTNLNRILSRLSAGLHESFVDAYRTALLERIGHHSPYLYTYKRILMWARLPGRHRPKS
jgi:trans-aconitate 2-methyltransferase